MSIFILLSFLLGGTAPPAPDTLVATTVAKAPALDGRVGDAEYGVVALHLTTAAGDVRVWLARSGDYVYIAASLPDTSFYWGDDFVVSLDADGSGDASPQTGDRQWYLRRVLDSSIVARAVAGRWNAPGQDPPPLGLTRHDADWDVASASTSAGWTVELRVRAAVLTGTAAKPSRIAFRTYNDQPSGWWSAPAPPESTPPQRVERTPQLWLPLRLGAGAR